MDSGAVHSWPEVQGLILDADLSVHFDAALFDMDGTLIDSGPFWKQAEREAFAEVGIDITDEMAAISSSMSTAQVAAHWFRHKPWEGRSLAELEEAVITRVLKLVCQHGLPLDGGPETLAGCRAAGLRTALVSNAPRVLCEQTLHSIGLAAAFDALFPVDLVQQAKPAPDLYLHAASALGIAPARCLVFEDSVVGVQAAVDAGMTVVAIPSGGQSFHAASHLPHLFLPTLTDFVRRYLASATA